MQAKSKPQFNAQNHIKQLKAGACLFRAQEPANSMYIVLDGTVAVVNEKANVQEVALLGKGDIFGERAYISKAGYPRQFSVYAKSDATVLEITRENLPKVEEAIPDLANKIIWTLLKRLSRTERMIRVLAPTEPKKRVVASILTFRGPNDELGELAEDGLFHPMTLDQAQDLTNLSNKEFLAIWEELFQKNILVQKEKKFYIVSEIALTNYADL